MGELNESEGFSLPNVTNQTSYWPCSGSRPSKTVEITTYAVLMLLSLIGNSFVFAVFYRNKTLRTPVNYFIVNMAVSDLLIPLIVLPWQTTEVYRDRVWLMDGVLADILCKLVMIAWGLTSNVSILSMVAIAVDRFHAILFAMKPALISRKTCGIILVTTWVASVAYLGHFFHAVRLVRDDDNNLKCVFLWEPESHTKEALKIDWISFLCLSTISAIVLTVLYSSIIIFLYRQNNNLHMAAEVVKLQAKENRNVTCMLVIVVVTFYAVWIPFHVESFLYYLKPNIRVPCFFKWIGSRMPNLYSIVNPIVYYTFNEKYHQGFRELLCCPWPCNNKCNECFQSQAPRQGEHRSENTRQTNDTNENIELFDQL